MLQSPIAGRISDASSADISAATPLRVAKVPSSYREHSPETVYEAAKSEFDSLEKKRRAAVEEEHACRSRISQCSINLRQFLAKTPKEEYRRETFFHDRGPKHVQYTELVEELEKLHTSYRAVLQNITDHKSEEDAALRRALLQADPVFRSLDRVSQELKKVKSSLKSFSHLQGELPNLEQWRKNKLLSPEFTVNATSFVNRLKSSGYATEQVCEVFNLVVNGAEQLGEKREVYCLDLKPFSTILSATLGMEGHPFDAALTEPYNIGPTILTRSLFASGSSMAKMVEKKEQQLTEEMQNRIEALRTLLHTKEIDTQKIPTPKSD